MATKKYVSLNRLSTFLDNLNKKFAPLSHKHTIADISNYKVDNQLSSTSVNPVQNKVLNAEFDAISEAMKVYEAILDDKSDKTHTHTIANITNLQSTLDGKANSSHGTHVTYSTTAPVMDGTASVGSANTVARSDHKHPTDTSRAAQTSLDSHTGNTTSHITSTERANWNTAYTHSQSAHAPSNAEPNQNAFSNVKIGDVTIAADIKTDTLTLVAGNNVTITPDATNDKITITSKDTVYTHPTTSGNKHIPSGGSSGQILRWASDGTAAWGADNNTTYTLGSFGVTATKDELNVLDGITATTTELNYTDGVKSNIQSQLDSKAASSHTHTIANITNLQSTLDGKSSTSHTHNYAGSTSAGGAANTLGITDTRNVNDTPTEITNKIGGRGIQVDFKSTSTVGLSNGTYAAVLSISPWGDTQNWSGGKNTQLGFCDDGRIQVRKGNGSGWSTWNTLIDSSTIGNQSVKYATSAGSSTKATQDASGNTITSTYATKSELSTAQSTLQTSINGKANSSHTHTIANVTNLQTTLDGKAASSHNHAASNITSGTLSSDRLPTVPIAKGGTGATTAAGALTNLGITATAAELNKMDGVTATTTELNYVDGVTSNIQTQLNGKAASSHTHNKDTINSVHEAKVEWGGRNISGSVSPIDAACSNIHSANRFTFAKAAGITIEYSTNGSSYSAYSTTTDAKINLVSGIGSTYYIGARSTSTTVNDKLRITLHATNMGVYTRLQKLLINISTSYATGSNVIIERAMKGSETTFVTVGTYQISGWSGWNSIPIGYAFGGGDTQTSNVAILRLTFGITGVNSSQTSNALSVSDIIGIGDTYWSYPSTMAKTGHLYSYDSSQNATFPASITGTGYLSMNRKSGTTIGSYSIALGQDCEASGSGSFAEGGMTVASGRYSHAEGYQSKATATYAHAEGVSTTASNMYAHAEGNTTTASGMGCHAEGCETTASGINTHAEGLGTQATSNGDHAEGAYTVASGVFSHAEGYYTKAASSYQHVQGQYNIVDSANTYLHIVGNGTAESARSNAHTLDKSGNAWYAGEVYVGGTGQSSGKKLVKLETSKSTISSLSSGWTVYGSNTTPTVRKFGNSVSLTGALKNSSALTLNTNHVQVFTIPSGYRPSQDIVAVCQGSGANRYVLQITTAGVASIGRYGTTSFTEVAASSWFPFHVSWIME